MNRDKMVKALEKDGWDVLIIGGGATGLGAAVDAASRGYRTLLLEQSDFAKGTSSRSTKLIHGGLRYLQQGNISLVKEALHERGLLCKNAPHLVHHLPFLVPNYHWWEGPFYGVGLKVYDLLAGKLGIEKSEHLSRAQTLKAIPTLEPEGLRGGVIYYDGQFDDSRLAIALAQTAADEGAVLVNYMRVTDLIKKGKKLIGVKAQDGETKKTYQLHARVVINATGVFSDELIHLDNAKAKKIIAPSQGVHIVLDKSFQPGKSAILVPHTEDKRVVFLVPWHDRVLVGTTDTPVSKVSLEPKPLKEEIAFLLKYAARYLTKDPTAEDVLSVFAGLRPLVKAGKGKKTAALSRDHTILIAPSGLITIAGGKWTTYRKMAEDVIDKAQVVGGLPKNPCRTQKLRLHGWKRISPLSPFATYGSDATKLKKTGKPLHPNLPYLPSEVIWAVRKEMARTVEDVLARRTRALLLDARASIEIAPLVAELMAKELGYGKEWQKKQVAAYKKLARGYFIET
jgi:glycerol-3-phosphate dehydrogenase